MVKQILNKVVAMFIILALTMGNLLLVATQSYAEFEELEEQKRATSDKNVSFDTYFFVDEKNVHSVTLETSNEAIVNFEINVGEGYLKDSKIELNNPNFEIISIENQSVEGIVSDVKANQIILNQISSNTRVIVSARIKMNHKEMVEVDFLGRETNVIFTSNYTNIKGKTKQINSNIVIRVDWTSEANSIIDTNVEKYMFLNNKTVIQTKVTSGINENVLPIKNTYIKAISPQIDGVNAQDVRVSAVNTIATNGIVDGNSFSKENYTYNKETGIVEINVDNTPNNENKISWKNGTDEYIVTYIYDGIHNIPNINLNVTNNITTYKNTQITNEIKKTQEITISGNNVDFELKATENLSKGYMYAASIYETEYLSNWSANISYIDGTDTLIFKQNTDRFVKADGKTEYVNSYYKQTKINKSNFEKLLGEDGQAEIYSGENLIGTINKNTSLDENGNYVYNYGEPISNIMIKTTKPASEGKIVIENVKAITATSPYSINQLREFLSIENSLVGSSLNQETQDLKVNTNLSETSTKAILQIGKESLSTVVTNENVEIRAILESDDITDDLYRNPTIRIELPEEVESVNIKSVNVLFNDQMEVSNINIESGRIINLQLTGEQTNFVTDGNKGITIIINTDITLFKTAASKETQVTMKYSNEKAIRLENDGITSTPVNISAPVGVIALNSIENSVNGEAAVSLESQEKEISLERNSSEQIVKYTNTIINNNNDSISNIKILGNIPFENDNYGSTINVKLQQQINSLDGIDYTVYYSENENATSDIDNIENGWNQEITDNIKAYLIVINHAIEHGEVVNFEYNLIIPEGLQYGTKVTSTYKVEYEEGSLNSNEIATTDSNNVMKYVIAQAAKNEIVKTETASIVTATTGEGVILSATLEDNLIENTACEEQYIKYTINVYNSGTVAAENVVVSMDIPENLLYAETDGGMFVTDETIKTSKVEIGNIEPEKDGTADIYLYLNKTFDSSIDLKATITCNNNENIEKVISLKCGERIIDNLNFYYEGDSNTLILGEASCFYLNIINEKTINNMEIKIKIPQELDYNGVTLYNVDETDENDDSKELSNKEYSEKYENGILTININKVDFELFAKIKVTPNKLMDKISLTAAVSYDGKNQVVMTNVKVEENEVKADIKSNYEDGQYLKAGNKVKYTVSIENIGTIDTTELVKFYLADEFEFDFLKMYVNGEELTDEFYYNVNAKENYIGILADIPVNKTVEIEIVIPITMEHEFDSKEITTSVLMEDLDIEKKYTYKLIKYGSDSKDEPDNPNNSDEPEDKKFKIYGTAWIDANKNGQMDKNECKMSNVGVKAIDKNGNELSTANTDSEGKYNLDNLSEGEYTIVFEYDTNKYIPTIYQAEGIEESVNSNAIKSTFNGKEVATTNTIKISDRNVPDINIGLVEGTKFDLKLEKKVKQISMRNTKTSKVKKYNNQLAKIDLDYKYINDTQIAVEYEIIVTNEGDISGYATKIIDYLPKEFDFSSELNKDWYTNSKGNAETKVLENTEIKPGESATITLVLTKNMTENGNGIICNTAEIAETYNELVQKDIDSTEGNNIDGEDDQSSANVILGLKTGGAITYISLTITLMTLICLGAYEINKRVIKI